MRADRVQMEPITLRSGEIVRLLVTHSVLTPVANETVTAREAREVRCNGGGGANPTSKLTRINGTVTSALPITLPSTAGWGTYETTTTVAVGDRLSRGPSSFAA